MAAAGRHQRWRHPDTTRSSRRLRREREPRRRLVVLRCFDGVKVAVPVALAQGRSGLVVAAAADGERVVDVLGNVHGHVVAEVAAYWEGRAAAKEEEAAAFDTVFLAGLRHDALVDLIHAAHHLGDAALRPLHQAHQQGLTSELPHPPPDQDLAGPG